MISKCSKCQKFPEIQKNIRKLTNDINDQLEKIETEYLETTPKMKQNINNHDKILLNLEDHYLINKHSSLL